MPPRQRNRLNALKVKSLTEPGRYADGGGLYLFVSKAGARAWVFRYSDRITGKLRDKGLGPAADVSLERARDRAAKCRIQLTDNIDPITAARAERAESKLEYARRLTFADCMERYLSANEAAWRNVKHRAQWRSTLDSYAKLLLPLPVAAIDTALVIRALEPIWSTKTETATRVRQRIEAVLNWASARGFRAGENPARWRGHLDKLLPKPAKLKNVEHRPALAYTDICAFMAELRTREGLAAKCLELQILTATRPGEAAGALWEEFDLDSGTWIVPADRMKAFREHRVPLCPSLRKMLKALPARNEFVFPSSKNGKAISTAASLQLLKDMRPGIVPHGFRSTFRDWAADQTAYPQDIAEAALAHVLKDKTEAAYRRTDMFDKRRRLMDDWGRFCDQIPNDREKVTPISGAAGKKRRA